MLCVVFVLMHCILLEIFAFHTIFLVVWGSSMEGVKYGSRTKTIQMLIFDEDLRKVHK